MKGETDVWAGTRSDVSELKLSEDFPEVGSWGVVGFGGLFMECVRGTRIMPEICFLYGEIPQLSGGSLAHNWNQKHKSFPLRLRHALILWSRIVLLLPNPVVAVGNDAM